MSIEVLIADDSQFLRKKISDILTEHESISIVDFAKDGEEAVRFVKKYKPDVLVLDLLMPKMNGLDAFKLIMKEQPTPTVILSAISPKNLDSSIQALLMGAFDYLIKPGGIGAKDLPRFREELLEKVLLASQSQIKKIFQVGEDLSSKRRSLRQEIVKGIFDFGKYLNKLAPIEEIKEKPEVTSYDKEEMRTILKVEVEKVSEKNIPSKREQEISKPDAIESAQQSVSTIKTTRNYNKNKVRVPAESRLSKKIAPVNTIDKLQDYAPDLKPVRDLILSSNVIVIGASVGGPRTITAILKEIPLSIRAPILIVQHLSAHFTEAFAENLNSECSLKIKVGRDGEILQNGTGYIAPGEMHMEISVKNGKPSLKVYKGNPVNFCMPSIDVLFFSAAKIYRSRTMGILLTGMGSDGVNGLGAIQKVRGKTIAESEETSILYAMPKFAAERGLADYIMPNFKIAEFIASFTK
ncbi:hypothetical protein LCGC14_0881710 [marine sediment metagenome]|uniref:protein-glutamate methylesterase n=1 Tax=marine sediment metagenome TaxID=412755 RepID=A0A0F9RL68_9ZZZZ